MGTGLHGENGLDPNTSIHLLQTCVVRLKRLFFPMAYTYTNYLASIESSIESKSILFYFVAYFGWSMTSQHSLSTSLVLFAAALVELAKFIPVHFFVLSSYLFFYLPLLHFPVTVPYRIVFTIPEDFLKRRGKNTFVTVS